MADDIHWYDSDDHSDSDDGAPDDPAAVDEATGEAYDEYFDLNAEVQRRHQAAAELLWELEQQHLAQAERLRELRVMVLQGARLVAIQSAQAIAAQWGLFTVPGDDGEEPVGAL